MFLHVMLEGQRLQVRHLVKRKEILDDICSVVDESPARGHSCITTPIPNSSKPGLK